jgi:hypothetical protein
MEWDAAAVPTLPALRGVYTVEAELFEEFEEECGV